MVDFKALFGKVVSFLKKPVISHTIAVLAAKSIYSKVAVAAVFAALGLAQ